MLLAVPEAVGMLETPRRTAQPILVAVAVVLVLPVVLVAQVL
jgi:hypothetical protein